jgi:hypothetical protein
MKKSPASPERPSTVKRPQRVTAAEQENDRRLTDRYAEAARKNELRDGDELAALEPVGRKKPK